MASKTATIVGPEPREQEDGAGVGTKPRASHHRSPAGERQTSSTIFLERTSRRGPSSKQTNTATV